MNFNTTRVLLAAALLVVAGAALAAKGGPIGGVIVKGGKNPGGQMRVVATTDGAGNFTARFAEGGSYTFEFEARSVTSASSDAKPGMQVEYVVTRTGADAAATRTQSSSASRHTPFHNRLENARMVVTLPQGGGEIRGVLQSLPASDAAPAAPAITGSGVGVPPSKPHGGANK